MKKKILAGLLSAVTLCSSIPAASTAIAAAPTTKVVYFADFEDGSNDFTAREGSAKITFNVVDSGANGSGKCLECSEREKNWQGPQIALDGMLEPGVEYIASAWVKAEWHNDVKLSMEYTDSSGERKYSNLASVISNAEWVQIPEIKFSVPKGVTKSYLYIECNDTAKLYVDDFKITTAPVYEIEQDIPSLKDVYSKYFKIGTAATSSEIAPASAQNLVKKHFNSLTPGNELKPDSILDKAACQAMAASGDDTNPQVNLAPAAELLDFARENNIAVRGHVLVWHSQTPVWFFKENFDENADYVSKEKMLKRMENYIKNVFAAIEKDYSDVNFYAWDVVNEAWTDSGTPRQPGDNYTQNDHSAWVQVFGDNSFIKPAFEYARKYAPKDCKLYYNDFNEYMPDKTKAIVNMANELKAEGLIDGIGMQSHLDIGFPTASAYTKALAAFAETGLDIQVTELDATIGGEDVVPTDELFEKQAQYYSDIMDACVEYADSISAVVFWGTTDDKSWRAYGYPLLFNEDFTAKPAYYSIIDGMEIPPTEPSDEPDYIPGDVNGDKAVNVIDSAAMRRYLVTDGALLGKQVASSLDADGDGYFKMNDLILLNQYILGKDVELKYHDWNGKFPEP